jgi:hypothetical protein
MRVLRLKERYPTAKVELWCEDEHRLGLKPIVRKVWSPVGERPRVRVHQRYEWTYLYAFARPDSGQVHWLILPTVNAEVFSVALEHFAREVGAGSTKRILLVLDNAGWHTAKRKLLECQRGYTWSSCPPIARNCNPPRGFGRSRTKRWPTATSERSRNCRRHWWTDAWHYESSPSSSVRIFATTGGRRQREKQGYSNGLGITRSIGPLSVPRCIA